MKAAAAFGLIVANSLLAASYFAAKFSGESGL